MFFFLFFLVFSMYSCGSNVNNTMAVGKNFATSPPGSAEKLPSLSLKDVNGNTINLTDFKGKKVFVNMWASWCPPCRNEMPSIQSLYEKTLDNNVQFVMIPLMTISVNLFHLRNQPVYQCPHFIPMLNYLHY